MQADSLSAEVWNAIYRKIEQSQMRREVTIGVVLKRDVVNKLVWLEEFGDTPIPLVSHDYTFSHFDTQPDGSQVKRGDPNNEQFHVQIAVPKVGTQVIVLKPLGRVRFPMCIGQIQSKGHW